MSFDFNKPTVSNEYTAVPGQIRDNEQAAATMFDNVSGSNIPTYAKRILYNGNSIEYWDGASWVVIGYLAPEAERVGVIKMYASSSAPSGYLLCNGAAVSRATYSALFGVIGETYGAGDGVTTFNTPNLCGKFPVGYDGGGYQMGTTGGESTVTLSEANMPTHSHSGTTGTESQTHSHDISHTHGVSQIAHRTGSGDSGDFAAGSTFQSSAQDVTSGGASTSNSGNASQTHSHTITTDTKGSSTAHQNLPPFLTINYIIKT